MAQPPQQQKGIVKSVLSGDTLILRQARPGPKGSIPKERILHLAGITAPRMGSSQREDEPHAFPSREFLRAVVVGKEITFTVLHQSKAQETGPTDITREYGIASVSPPGASTPQDLATLIISSGWARVRDSSPSEDPAESSRKEHLRSLSSQAEASSLGVFSETHEVQRTVSYNLSDAAAFLQETKGRPLDAIVENVRDGSTMRVRILLSESEHQMVNLSLAGVKAPRVANSNDPNSGDDYSEEAKFFVESRLLQRQIKVVLLSSPASLGTSPLQQQSSSTPAPSSTGGFILPPPPPTSTAIFIGNAVHPNGNIAEFLCGAGLAKVVDWHAGLLSSFTGSMDRLRAAEKSAKERKAAIWENYVPTGGAGVGGAGPNGKANGAAGGATVQEKEMVKAFDGIVTRVWGPDQLSVQERNSEDGSERRIQLSSVRGPRPSEPKQAYWANEAKEFLRKKLIGKPVQVTIDYIKPREGDFDEKTCCTVKFGGAHTNIAAVLIEKGFASVLRHRRDDEDRSPDMDALVVAEQTAITEARGIHSTKEMTLPRIIDVSETSQKATSFLPFFKRAGRQPAVVEYVAAGSRFKVILPKEDKKLTLVLAGIRAPRTARNPGEKSEPFGNEAHRFASKFLQRDVEVEFESVDKTGGFIGSMYHAKTENVAVELVRAGLASIHAFTAEALPFSRALFAAEEEAKKGKKGMWSNFDPAVEEAEKAMEKAALAPAVALPTNYSDVVVSAVRPAPAPFAFFVQVLNASNSNGASLEKLMSEFANFHKTPNAKAQPGWTPKAGEIISAQWSEDDRWYRARVKRASAMKKECEVLLVDYGNEETIPFTRARPLDPKFKTLPPQAQEARLSFVKLAKPGSEYAEEALERFRYLAEGRKLIANIDHREPSLLHLRLIDPDDPRTARDPLCSLNSDLIREGLASIDPSVKYLSVYKSIVRGLEESTELAKRERLGQFEFGDVSEDP